MIFINNIYEKGSRYDAKSPIDLFETCEFLAYSKWCNKTLVGWYILISFGGEYPKDFYWAIYQIV